MLSSLSSGFVLHSVPFVRPSASDEVEPSNSVLLLNQGGKRGGVVRRIKSTLAMSKGVSLKEALDACLHNLNQRRVDSKLGCCGGQVGKEGFEPSRTGLTGASVEMELCLDGSEAGWAVFAVIWVIFCCPDSHRHESMEKFAVGD